MRSFLSSCIIQLQLFFLLLAFPLAAQTETLRQDSLRNTYQKHPADSSGLEALVQLSRSYFGSNLDSAMSIGRRALAAAESAGSDEFIAESQNSLGIARLYQGNNQEALKHFEAVLAIREKQGDSKLIAGAANNVAIAQQELGNYSLALDNHIRSLKIKEELMDTARVRISYNNIGLIYEQLEDYTTARSYYTRAKKLLPLHLDSVSYATNTYNIGVTFFKQVFNDSAALVFKQSLPIVEELGDMRMIGLHHLHFGVLDQRKGKIESARDKISRALQIFEKLGKEDQIVAAQTYLGLNYLADGQATQALKYCKKAWAWAKVSGSLDKKVDCLDCLHRSYQALGQTRQAYDAALQYFGLRDSLGSGNAHKQIVRKDLDYAYRKKQLADSLETAQTNAMVKVEYENKLDRQQTVSFFLLVTGVLLLGLLILFVFIYRQKKQLSQKLEMRVKQRTKTLQEQKDQLAEYAFINAHLLRQPLTQILGLITLIQNSQDPVERDEYIALLQKSSLKLDQVIHDIRDVVEKEKVSKKPALKS